MPRNETVQLPSNVTRESMSVVQKFLTYHSSTPSVCITKPISTSVMRDIVGDWDASFVSALNAEQLSDVIMAANFLNIPALINLALCRVASKLFRKTTSEMERAMASDFSS